MRLLFSIILLSLFISCTPSTVLYNKHVIYNFKDEGFLAPNLLQTVGTAEVRLLDGGLEAARVHCIEEAFYTAKNKAIRVMLHTRLDIPGSESGSGISGSFARDYPVEFRQKDYLKAAVDFKDLLDEGFLALQDSRTTQDCSVVYRIIDDQLIRKIKGVELSFCVNYESYKVFSSFFNRKNYCREEIK